MPLANKSLSVAPMNWELLMQYDMLLEDEYEYLYYEPFPMVFIVEIKLFYLK